jgi:mannose-6-phosphate isomerase-like protein (cupin superfamily)
VPVKIVSLDTIAAIQLPGRQLQWLVTPETVGAEMLSIAIMKCPARSVVRPMHAHRDTEEVLLILEGEGEAWVDGDRAFFKRGDAVLFPSNSRHQVRNTGSSLLMTASIFSPPTKPGDYITYAEDAFADLGPR